VLIGDLGRGWTSGCLFVTGRGVGAGLFLGGG